MSLSKILEAKRERIKFLKKNFTPQVFLSSAKNRRADFLQAVTRKNRINIIAEFKRSSPSKGKIIKNRTLDEIVKEYEKNGAAALSILTEEDFFSGNIEDILSAKDSVNLPILRKDFIIDEIQIYETSSIGADAILLIAKILDKNQLSDYFRLSVELNLTPLIEIHTEEELEGALKLNPPLLGINNRDLETFKTDINVTRRLINLIPKGISVVSESGISDAETIRELNSLGVDAFLIGESLLSSLDPGKTLRNFLKSSLRY